MQRLARDQPETCSWDGRSLRGPILSMWAGACGAWAAAGSAVRLLVVPACVCWLLTTDTNQLAACLGLTVSLLLRQLVAVLLPRAQKVASLVAGTCVGGIGAILPGFQVLTHILMCQRPQQGL